MQDNKPFAEIIDSSLHGSIAQSWEWNSFPAFGSLITVSSNNRTLFCLVHQIKTGSMDPMRYPFPYQKTEEELRKEQPQIFEFLKTTFSCLTVGYKQKGTLYHLLAPEPPKIHSFVQSASKEQGQEFFSNDKYLHLIFSLANNVFNLDELLLALLNYQKQLEILNEKKMNRFIHTFSLLTGNDYRRLKLFLQRAQPIFIR
jgi:hypothetical protein